MSQENVEITRSVNPIRRCLLSGMIALGLLALSPATAWAAYPGANGLIAYSEPRAGGLPSYEGQNWELFTIPPQGGDPTRLTDNAIPDTQPSWSADGQRLTFIRGSAYSGQKQNVWTMRADGSHQRRVTYGRADFSPSFSPGGGQIVMSHVGNIVVIDTDGTDPVRLTRDRRASDPVFSPNGKRILFSGRPRKGLHWGLWVMHRDGTHKHLLADQANDPESGNDAEYFDPDYSPDGASIVFQRDDCRGGCALSVILMRSDGRGIRTLSSGRAPIFSPNGYRIAALQVSCDLDDNCDGALISFDRHGDHRRAVRDPADPFQSFGGPSWQPIP
jgi:Tol biopolymer transport system component